MRVSPSRFSAALAAAAPASLTLLRLRNVRALDSLHCALSPPGVPLLSLLSADLGVDGQRAIGRNKG
jgi:hypothetical protein